MNEQLILAMIEPYLHENSITYSEFESIFSFLSLHEQYEVTDILAKHNLELNDGFIEVPDYKEIALDDDEEIIEIDDESERKELEILYDLNLFKDSNSLNEKSFFIYNEIKQSNEILCKLYQDGSSQALQDLCIKNKRLVDKYAGMYLGFSNNNLAFEDLEEIGFLGLIKAAGKFDYQKGYAFSTYAVFWIRQAIVREIYDNGFTIRIPVHMMERISKVTKLDSDFAKEEADLQARIECIARETDLTFEQIMECLVLRHNYQRSTSLNIPIGEEEDTELQDLIEDTEALTTEDIVFQNIMREALLEMLKDLKTRERKIIELRFGFLGGRCWTLEEVGNLMGVTRERIRQIEAKALKKLRHPSRSKKLRDYL